MYCNDPPCTAFVAPGKQRSLIKIKSFDKCQSVCKGAEYNEIIVENNIEDESLDIYLVSDYKEQEPSEKRDLDLTDLANLKLANFQNSFIAYLNINSLRYKIIDLRHTLSSAGLELVAISETKLSSEFPDPQFQIDGYQFPPLRKGRDKHGGGLMVFAKNDIIAKRLTELQPKYIECICVEFQISKKNWIIFVI